MHGFPLRVHSPYKQTAVPSTLDLTERTRCIDTIVGEKEDCKKLGSAESKIDFDGIKDGSEFGNSEGQKGGS